MNDKIGYPDDVADATTSRSARATTRRTRSRRTRFELGAQPRARWASPLDRDEWQMTPPTVNAYYDPSLNEMVVPGRRSSSRRSSTRRSTAAVNFGDDGATSMGHELTHGFDDEGSQFDGAGNLRNWWSEDTDRQVRATQTKCVSTSTPATRRCPA